MDSATLLILVMVAAAVGVALALVVFRRRPERARGEAPDAALGPAVGSMSSLGRSIRRVLGAGLGEEAMSELRETLLASDLGPETSDGILETVRRARPATSQAAIELVGEALRSGMHQGSREMRLAGSPSVILVVGVNGTGKTTTIAKIGRWLMSQGTSVVLGGADTFRAAAGRQLQAWGDRLATRVVVGAEGADPASVAYDAVEAARAAGVDVVIIDTAGRLHGRRNLMEELVKIHRVAGGESGVDEVLLVLDASLGQNGLAQVREFAGAVPVSGIVLTKLDGTAKGGIVAVVEKEMGVPVKFVGTGEGIRDLAPFDPEEFIAALLEET